MPGRKERPMARAYDEASKQSTPGQTATHALTGDARSKRWVVCYAEAAAGVRGGEVRALGEKYSTQPYARRLRDAEKLYKYCLKQPGNRRAAQGRALVCEGIPCVDTAPAARSILHVFRLLVSALGHSFILRETNGRRESYCWWLPVNSVAQRLAAVLTEREVPCGPLKYVCPSLHVHKVCCDGSSASRCARARSNGRNIS